MTGTKKEINSVTQALSVFGEALVRVRTLLLRSKRRGAAGRRKDLKHADKSNVNF